jgi:hypothetical protein
MFNHRRVDASRQAVARRQGSASMQCFNCLNKKARVRRPLRYWEYVLAPLILPVHCKRCLNTWHFPTVLVLLEHLVERLDERRR